MESSLRNKNFLLVLLPFCLFIFYSTVYGQLAGNYDFSSRTDTFIEISNGIDLDTIEAFGEVSDIIPLGFTFHFEGISYTKVKACTNGWITFDTTETISYWQRHLAEGKQRPMLSAILWSLDGHEPGAQASYKTTGIAPNRVFTMQWLNWQWGSATMDSIISFQIKLFESKDEIEFHYRQEKYISQATVCAIGISGVGKGKGHFLSLLNASSNPGVSSQIEYTIWSAPATNQIYKFSPPSCPEPKTQFYTYATDTSIFLDWEGWQNNTWNIEFDTAGHRFGSGRYYNAQNISSFNVTGLQKDEYYEFYIRDSCGINDVSKWVGPYKVSTAIPTPFMETFELNQSNEQSNMTNGWICLDSYDYLWQTKSGTSSSNGTGPSFDHTLGNSQGKYLVVKSDEGDSNDISEVYSPFFSLDSLDNPTLTYWSHRWGAGFDKGLVDVLYKGQWLNIDSVFGSSQSFQAESYNKRYASLLKFKGYFVRLRWRSRRNTNQGDWAIDDVSIINNGINLLNPKDSSIIDLNGAYNTLVKFKWNSEKSFASNAIYHFLADTNLSSTTSSLINRLSHSNGSDSGFRYTLNNLDTLFNYLSMNIGDTLDLYWTVYAENNSDTIHSVDTFLVRLVRGRIAEPFYLKYPTNFSSFQIEGNQDKVIPFLWTNSLDGVFYEFSVKSSLQQGPFFRTIVSDTNFNLDFHFIDSVLESLGALTGQSRPLYWNVQTIHGQDSLKSENGQLLISFAKGILTDTFKLRSPVEDTTFVFFNSGKSTHQTTFKWQEAQINGDGDIRYTWMIDHLSSSFSNPLKSFSSDNLGIDESLTLADSFLRSVFDLSGTIERDTFHGKWTVVTDLGDTASHFRINILWDKYFGIRELNKEEPNIYPNPCKTFIILEFAEPIIGEIELYNSAGKKCHVKKLDGSAIFKYSLPESLENGTYLLQIKDNELRYSTRIIVL